MNDETCSKRKVMMGVLLLGVSAYGKELRTGIGYGQQVGSNLHQNNAVVDVVYDFYEEDWKSLQLALGGGVSWLWNDFDDEDVLMFSVLPSFRYCFYEGTNFKPYLFAGAGPSYMTEPQLGHQSLGGYFAFNGFYGLGMYLGKDQRWNVNWFWRHISNAGIHSPNSGIDIPFCVTIGRTL